MSDLFTRERLGHLLRVAICLMSFGFVFPYALMENIDAAKLAAEEQLKAAKAVADKSAAST